MELDTVVKEAIDLDARPERLGIWLRKKTGRDGGSPFVDGFVAASLTVCIGAMAVACP